MSWLFEFDPMFHAPTKNIEVDFEFIKEKDTHLRFIPTCDHSNDIFTEGVKSDKLMVYNSHPLEEGC
jgi:hypothetical protein